MRRYWECPYGLEFPRDQIDPVLRETIDFVRESDEWDYICHHPEHPEHGELIHPICAAEDCPLKD